jgi:hypothetical protein
MPAATPNPVTRQLAESFELNDIKRAKAPDGGTGQDWHRYIITQGPNKITGYRQGSQRAVTQAVKEIVLELNERRNGKKGRVHLTPSRKPKSNPT